MERFKLFITNFIVYGFGGIIGKIIPLIMLPVVTGLMPDTTYFGLNDISTVVVSFGSSLAVMGMYDAMFRMFFDDNDREYQQSICSSTLFFTLASSMVVTAVLVLFQDFFSVLFFGSIQYKNLLFLSALSILIGSTNSIVSAPTRITNQRKVYLATNLLAPLISYSISIPLLRKGWYLAALPLASAASALAMEVIFWILNCRWFTFRLVNKRYIRQMLKIALPLLPNFLIYWIFSSADRLMIAKMLGNDQAGIYAIGSKTGQISQLIYTAFAGGWQYFAFSTMKDQDQVELTSKVMEYLGAVSFVAGMMMTCFCSLIFQVLFKGDYLKGAAVAPYLFMSPLLLMLYQVGCNQFLVIKKTWPSLCILSLGAVLNLILNYTLIPILGIEGAALATLCGYIISVAVCTCVLHNLGLLRISFRFSVSAVIMGGYLALWRLFIRHKKLPLNMGTAALCCVGILILYKKELRLFFSALRKNKN